MEEELVALYQARAKKKELEEGKKAGSTEREIDDETLLTNLKGSPLSVGTLEEVGFAFVQRLTYRLLMMTMPL